MIISSGAKSSPSPGFSAFGHHCAEPDGLQPDALAGERKTRNTHRQ